MMRRDVWIRRSFAVAAVVLSFGFHHLRAQAVPEVHSAMFHGRLITYEVRNGLAFYERDILLGTADEVRRREEERASGRFQPLASVRPLSSNWPNGTIHYSLPNDFPNRLVILEAIAEWNNKLSGTINLVPCQGSGIGSLCIGQSNWVRVISSTVPNFCSSQVGMVGLGLGPQNLALSPSCTKRDIIHEFGHAIGLWHEQSRTDRGKYITVLNRNILGNACGRPCAEDFEIHSPTEADPTKLGRDIGPYNYDSVMHYGPYISSNGDGPTMVTIPQGIPIGTGGQISAGDIDAVLHAYGRPPTQTTIATTPSGLEVVVDGVVHISPKSFAWTVGSVHVISARAGQKDGGGSALHFARWSDSNLTLGESLQATRVITVSSNVTVYLANYATIDPAKPCTFLPGYETSGNEFVAFQDAFQRAGGEATIGCATSGVQVNGFFSFHGTTGHYQTFAKDGQRTDIEYMTNNAYAGKAFYVRDPMYDKWAGFGFNSNNILGYPISDPSPAPLSPQSSSGKVSAFERGHLYWRQGDGKAFETHGLIDDKSLLSG